MPECVYLVGNKCDQCHGEGEAEKTGREVSQKYGVTYLKTSARSGEGLEHFLELFAEKVDAACSSKKVLVNDLEELRRRPNIKVVDPGEKIKCRC
jgi:putative ribosome biogenesis GTPase RsgA